LFEFESSIFPTLLQLFASDFLNQKTQALKRFDSKFVLKTCDCLNTPTKINPHLNSPNSIHRLPNKMDLANFERNKPEVQTEMTKGKFEKVLVDPYLPGKIIPPDYIRDVLQEADKDFPQVDFEYEIPHKWPIEEYKNQYEELERLMLEVLKWRQNWFGKVDVTK
jgi:hypothetical protein